MLFLKFSPDAQASFSQDQDGVKDKTENVKKSEVKNNDANTYNLSDADLENINDNSNATEDKFSVEKTMSIDQFTDNQIENIKNIIDNQDYDKITSNPYLISALYYSQKFLQQISNEKYQTSAAKKIMGQVANLIDDDFREGALQALEEQSKALEKEQKKSMFVSEVSPIESIDYGHGVNHNDAIDLYTPEGSDVSAMSPGIVVLAERGWQEANEVSTSSTKGGNTVIVYNYLTKEFFRYAHLDEVNLEPGQLVTPGDKVGTVGHTGTNACKPGHGGHLHFEINAYNSDQKTNQSVLAPQLKERIEDSRVLASN